MNLLPPQEFNDGLLSCWKRLQSGRRIVVHRSIIGITGDIKSAAYLSQLLYWLRVGVDVSIRDGWIFKTIAETQNETGLSKPEQRLCKDKLINLGLIQTNRIGQGARLAVKVNLEAVTAAICKLFGLDNTAELTIEEWRKQELGFIRDYFSDSVVYHLDLVWLTGDIHSAVILSNALFQSARRGTPGSRSFTKQRLYYSATMKEWEEATSLGYKPQRRARDMLKNAKLIVEAHYNQSARIFTHVDGLRLMHMLEQKIKLAKKPEMNVRKLRELMEIEKEDTQPTLLGISDTSDSQSRSAELANLEVSNRQTQKCRSDKSANSEMSIRQSQKSGSAELAKSEVTNRQTIYKNTYNNPPMEGMTTTTTQEQSDAALLSDGVVVVSSEFVNAEPVSRFEDLIWPKLFTRNVRAKAQNIFDRYFPDGKSEQLQEVLDEIAGQTKEVRSPLGLLTILARNAAEGTLVCVFAPLVQDQRKQAALVKQNLENALRDVPEDTVHEKVHEVDDQVQAVRAGILDIVRKSSKKF